MITDRLCCNCEYYDGVHGSPGCAECKVKKEVVLWNGGCEHLWPIPKRLKVSRSEDGEEERIVDGSAMWAINNEDETAYCSSCGLVIDSWVLAIFYNYCPRCGAEMNKGADICLN